MDTPDSQPGSLLSALQQTDMLFPLGTIVNDTYRIEEFIAAGSMGEVYICSHQHLEGAVFALKVLRVSGLEKDMDPSVSIRFKKEVQISLRINHPNVVSSYAFIQQKDYIAFVMEYVKGGDLADYLQYNPRAPVSDVVKILSQSCSGLQAIHNEGITHRDVKPENLLLTEDGDIKITDFGIARIKDGQRLTAQGSVLGTMEYLSPEYLRDGECDARSDLYAIGLIGYELLTSKQPFLGRTMIEALHKKMKSELQPAHIARPDCPVELSEILRKALEPNPDHRYQNTSEMIMDFEYVANILKGTATSSVNTVNPSLFATTDDGPKISGEPLSAVSNFVGTVRTISKEVGDLVKHLSVKDPETSDGQNISEEEFTEEDRLAYQDSFSESPAAFRDAYIGDIPEQTEEDTSSEIDYLNRPLSADTDQETLAGSDYHVPSAFAPPEQTDQVGTDVESDQTPAFEIEVFAPQGVEVELVGSTQAQMVETAEAQSSTIEPDEEMLEECESREFAEHSDEQSYTDVLDSDPQNVDPAPELIDFGTGLPDQLLDLIKGEAQPPDPISQDRDEQTNDYADLSPEDDQQPEAEEPGPSGIFPWSESEESTTPAKNLPEEAIPAETIPEESFPMEAFHVEAFTNNEASPVDAILDQALSTEDFAEDRIPNDRELKQMFLQGQSSDSLPSLGTPAAPERRRTRSIFSRLKNSEREILSSSAHRQVTTDRLFPENNSVSSDRLFPRPEKSRFRVFFLFLIFWLIVWSRFLL